MARTKKLTDETVYEQSSALTDSGRSKQIAAYALDLAEERIRNGTASNQLIVKFLDCIGFGEKEQLQIRKLREEIKLAEAKTEAYRSAKNTEALYAEAIEAMKRYTPQWKE